MYKPSVYQNSGLIPVNLACWNFELFRSTKPKSIETSQMSGRFYRSKINHRDFCIYIYIASQCVLHIKLLFSLSRLIPVALTMEQPFNIFRTLKTNTALWEKRKNVNFKICSYLFFYVKLL